jgi:hypothetical protein
LGSIFQKEKEGKKALAAAKINLQTSNWKGGKMRKYGNGMRNEINLNYISCRFR